MNTYHPKVAEFWEKKVPVRVLYELDGFPTWQIDVDDDHPDLKDPEFIGLAMSEKMFLLPKVFERRIRLPLYGLTTASRIPAELQDTTGHSGLAIARNSSVYADMAIPPGISLLRFRTVMDLHAAFAGAKKRGVERVLFFVKPGICETIPIDMALTHAKKLLH